MNRKSIHLITALVFVCGMVWTAYGQDTTSTKTDPARSLLDQAEKAHDADDFGKTMSLLRKAEQLSPDNPEILWKDHRRDHGDHRFLGGPCWKRS